MSSAANPTVEREMAGEWADLTLAGGNPLHPENAVAALLILDDGRYVMQLRESKEGIFYPGHWGCFGGAVQANEEPAEALDRELREELGFSLAVLEEFTRFDFDFTVLGQGKVYRKYFTARASRKAFDAFVLGEGAAVAAFTGRELLSSLRVTPYDAFAIWMHMSALRYNTRDN